MTDAAAQDITDAQYRLLAEFRFQIRSFLRFSEEVSRSSHLEPQQHQLLLALRGLPPDVRPTISALSHRLCLRHHTTVELTNRLVERGAVVRQHGLEDRREVLLQITKEGEDLLTQLSATHWLELKNTGPALAAALDSLLEHANDDDSTKDQK